jgi:hypothetical protein
VATEEVSEEVTEAVAVVAVVVSADVEDSLRALPLTLYPLLLSLTLVKII